MFLKWTAWLLIFSFGSLLFSFSSLSFATSYSRGYLTCKNFEKMEELYKADPESVDPATGYARCLIAKGDDEGLTLLYLIDEQQGNIVAAYYIAKYVHTDGTFEQGIYDRLDEATIEAYRVDEAIEAYLRVLALIDSEPNYPVPDYTIYEINMQMELTATYTVPALYNDKFLMGAQGIENYYLLQSPDYKGDRDLETYPEYNRYTVDSLNKMIKFANYCMNLPRKGHFDLTRYTTYKKTCRALKDTAAALLPMEIERLTFLENQTSCRDLSNCPEYDELADPMKAIVKQSLSDQIDILRPLPGHRTSINPE